MKVLFEKAKAKNARVQMSEAFITSVFWHFPADFRMHILILQGMKYSRMHRRETWY